MISLESEYSTRKNEFYPMTMLNNLMHRNPKKLTGLSVTPQGLGFARIAKGLGDAPLLDVCGFHSAQLGIDLTEQLAHVARANKLKKQSCAAVIDLGTYEIFPVEAPNVPEHELKSAVTWRIQEMIDYPVEEAVIDIFDMPGEQPANQPRFVYAVVVREATIREHSDAIRGAQMQLSAIDIPDLAIRNLAGLLPEDPQGVALLYITADRSLITITKQKSLYFSRSFPIGFNHLKSEDLNQSTDEDNTEIAGWYETLVLEIQRSVDYYESHFRQSPLMNLVLAPVEIQLPNLIQHLEHSLGISVRKLDITSILSVPQELDETVQARTLLAVGEALRQ
jgi:MSHA biogenesis protein MshI